MVKRFHIIWDDIKSSKDEVDTKFNSFAATELKSFTYGSIIYRCEAFIFVFFFLWLYLVPNFDNWDLVQKSLFGVIFWFGATYYVTIKFVIFCKLIKNYNKFTACMLPKTSIKFIASKCWGAWNLMAYMKKPIVAFVPIFIGINTGIEAVSNVNPAWSTFKRSCGHIDREDFHKDLQRVRYSFEILTWRNLFYDPIFENVKGYSEEIMSRDYEPAYKASNEVKITSTNVDRIAHTITNYGQFQSKGKILKVIQVIQYEGEIPTYSDIKDKDSFDVVKITTSEK